MSWEGRGGEGRSPLACGPMSQAGSCKGMGEPTPASGARCMAHRVPSRDPRSWPRRPLTDGQSSGRTGSREARRMAAMQAGVMDSAGLVWV